MKTLKEKLDDAINLARIIGGAEISLKNQPLEVQKSRAFFTLEDMNNASKKRLEDLVQEIKSALP